MKTRYTDLIIGKEQKVQSMLFIMLAIMAFVFHAKEVLAQDWSTSSTGGNSVQVTASAPGNSVTVQFAQQSSPPIIMQCDLIVGGTDPSSMFTGNLMDTSYSGIQLKINGDGQIPDLVTLFMQSEWGDWHYPGIQVSANVGEWTIVNIPLHPDKGWQTTLRTERYTRQQLWEFCLGTVESFVLRLEPSGSLAQAYSVSDFRLMGDGLISEAANLTPLQAYFGVDTVDALTAQMLATDSDGDGMTDYHEILSGTDPMDGSSVFAANVARSAGHNAITWAGVLGRRYAVWRSNNLLSGFQLIASDIYASITGEMTYEDASPVDGQPNFYKVVQY